MSSSINSLINPGQSTTSTAAAAATNNTQLNSTDFLTLLTTELKNQNPLSPMDDTQSLAQLAQFTSVQSMEQLQTSFSNFQSNFSVLQSASLIGQKVSVTSADAAGNSSAASGTIQAIQVINGTPEFTLLGSNGSVVKDSNGNPIMYTTAEITAIGA
ncbi:MAG: flagellar hook capping FlgD N-terminal domain-containing protein [Candidatus Velthaea sp.]